MPIVYSSLWCLTASASPSAQCRVPSTVLPDHGHRVTAWQSSAQCHVGCRRSVGLVSERSRQLTGLVMHTCQRRAAAGARQLSCAGRCLRHDGVLVD